MIQRIAKIISASQRVLDPRAYVSDNIDSFRLVGADYVILWELGSGFTVLEHYLDVNGSKTGRFVPAPDVTSVSVVERVKFILGDTNVKVCLLCD